jgi:DNA-binding MarR family transcriptional regulator
MLDAMGITYPQYLVLHLLWTEDGQTVGHLARQLDLEPSTLTPLLKRLEAAGHVTRARNPENERQVLIHVTEKGRALRTEVGCMGAALIANSGMSLEELAELNRKVRQLRDNLNRHLEK